jgi:hypothetical protein
MEENKGQEIVDQKVLDKIPSQVNELGEKLIDGKFNSLIQEFNKIRAFWDSNQAILSQNTPDAARMRQEYLNMTSKFFEDNKNNLDLK